MATKPDVPVVKFRWHTVVLLLRCSQPSRCSAFASEYDAISSADKSGVGRRHLHWQRSKPVVQGDFLKLRCGEHFKEDELFCACVFDIVAGHRGTNPT